MRSPYPKSGTRVTRMYFVVHRPRGWDTYVRVQGAIRFTGRGIPANGVDSSTDHHSPSELHRNSAILVFNSSVTYTPVPRVRTHTHTHTHTVELLMFYNSRTPSWLLWRSLCVCAIARTITLTEEKYFHPRVSWVLISRALRSVIVSFSAGVLLSTYHVPRTLS